MAGRGSGGGRGGPEGRLKAHVLIIEARYYEKVGKELLAGAVAEVEARGCTYQRISVPGALELPQALAQAVGKGLFGARWKSRFDGVVALGCVIRGETSHYDIVCHNTNHWLIDTIMQHNIPFGNAVLTVDTETQALARARGGREGKGADAVRSCLRIIELARKFADAGP